MLFLIFNHLRISYPLSCGSRVNAGYELLWLDCVALAPGQIAQTYSGTNPTSVTATGVNTDSNLLLQGFTIGIEFKF